MRGGAWGFSTEISPGPSIPTLESLEQMLSPAELDTLWREPGATQLHAGKKPFDTLGIFNAALAARYGAPSSLADYVQKAQVMNYEAERAMFEAYGRNKYVAATGVVQWMMNNAWPSLIWHLFDYYLAPGGAYYGAKKGNELVHVQYSYDDRSVVVVNHGPQPMSGLSATTKVYNLDGSQKLATSAPVDAAPDSARRVFTLPALQGLSPVYFVQLTLQDAAGAILSSSFYWLSTTAETLDFQHSDWYHTPTATFADFTALATLPTVSLSATAAATTSGARGTVTVTLQNSTNAVAFFVTLKLTRGAGGRPVLPIFWSDNDVSLLPGEKRTFTATFDVADLQAAAPALTVSGWNVAAQTLTGF
jgi:exo-1,4-beta-D-glucosaminidase